MQGKVELTSAQQAVADAVKDYLKAAAVGTSFTMAEGIAAAVRLVPSSSDQSHGRVQDVWNILQLQHARLSAGAASEVQRALLHGSVEHLEVAYYTHIQQRVRQERLAASSGGSGSPGSVIAGFVNASVGSGGDGALRAWLQVCCLASERATSSIAGWAWVSWARAALVVLSADLIQLMRTFSRSVHGSSLELPIAHSNAAT
jgi:hypothetical protein